MAITWTDNFNRADGPVGAPWVDAVGSIIIVSQTVTGDATTGGRAYYNIATPNDLYIKFKYSGGSIVGGATSVLFRYVDADRYYFLYFSPSVPLTSLYVRNYGNTVLDTKSERPSDGDLFEIRMVGSAITVLRNGANYLSGNNAAHASGYVGIIAGGSAQRQYLDDFEVGDYVPPTPDDPIGQGDRDTIITRAAQRVARPMTTIPRQRKLVFSGVDLNIEGGGYNMRDAMIWRAAQRVAKPFTTKPPQRKLVFDGVDPVNPVVPIVYYVNGAPLAQTGRVVINVTGAVKTGQNGLTYCSGGSLAAISAIPQVWNFWGFNTNKLCISITELAPVNPRYANGLSFAPSGELYVNTTLPIAYYANGWPVAANGSVCAVIST